MICIFFFYAIHFFVTAMISQRGGRDHIETTLQAEAGEDEAVIMVFGFQATDEEPLAAPPQPLINSTTGPQNHQTLTIHDQEFIRPHSQTSSMDTLADDSYWIVREAWPLRSLNLSNGAEEQHYTSNYDRIIDRNRNGLQMPSTTTIQKQIGAAIKYCQLPFSIGIFVVVAGTNQHTEPRNKFFLKLCYASFLVSILTGAILLTLTKQKFQGNMLVFTFIAAIAFSWDIVGLCFLMASYS